MSKHKRAVKEFYDRIAAEYHKQRYVSAATVSSYGMLRRRNAVMRLIDSARTDGKRLLDVGCGAGSYAPELVRRGHDVYCIDISFKMVKEAKRLLLQEGVAQRAHFCQGDVERLSFPPNMFDVIIAAGVLEYLETDDKAVKELYRVVKPNGVVIVTLNNSWSFGNFIRAITLMPVKNLISGYFPDRVSCSNFRTRTHSPKQFINYMRSCGFSLVIGEFCNLAIIPYNFRLPRAYFYLSEILENTLKCLGLGLTFGAYVGAFRKKT